MASTVLQPRLSRGHRLRYDCSLVPTTIGEGARAPAVKGNSRVCHCRTMARAEHLRDSRTAAMRSLEAHCRNNHIRRYFGQLQISTSHPKLSMPAGWWVPPCDSVFGPRFKPVTSVQSCCVSRETGWTAPHLPSRLCISHLGPGSWIRGQYAPPPAIRCCMPRAPPTTPTHQPRDVSRETEPRTLAPWDAHLSCLKLNQSVSCGDA